MIQSRPVIPVSTVCDILALFGRRDLFRLSEVCYRFNAIIQRYFHMAPYLVFNELEYGRSFKWKPSKEVSISLMPDRLFLQLIESKYVRFEGTRFSLSMRPVERLTSIKHVWEGRDLVIDSHWYESSSAMVALVRKCRSVSLSCIRATNILSELLRNCHDHIIVLNTSWSDSRQIVPVNEVIEFLFRKPHSSTPFKDLSIVAYQPLDEENCIQIIDAMRKKFLACTVPLLFQFSLSMGRTLVDEENFSVFNKHTKQHLNVVVSRSHISMQIY
ncbi:hypothetical protein DdX_15616 [Ditylenchus destructor]|uniref:F-box domain-containing protein n=1 Tax=Ditylenchus destructor TaxID=166010 RepID=A0AAD4MUM6_9BILA|nr:hypothetical protein DdX_15616 [Ditylenchus destructor]